MTREQAIKWLSRYVGNDGYTDEYQEVCRMALAALREQPRWISVEDGLPENEQRVLVQVPQILGFPKVDTDRFVDGRWVRWCKNVTHWMPLPEAPKEEV